MIRVETPDFTSNFAGHQPHIFVAAAMSLEAALNLSIPELLRVLNEKLGLECTRAQQLRLPSVPASITSLGAEVSTLSRPIAASLVVGSNATLQIESLEARAREISELIPSLRNLLRPVNRLPPEILSRIARFMDRDATDARPMIPLTHVCRYLRESIVSTPGNWTLISSGRVRLSKLSLERCRAAPLKLQLSIPQLEKNPRFTALIAPYIQNTESLDICSISTIRELAQALQYFPQSMPNLRTLLLSSDPPSPRAHVSADPFEQLTLALAHLSLESVTLFPSLRRLTTLKNLSIANLQLDLHIDALLDFLEANPVLERASLTVRLTQRAHWDSRRQFGIVNRLKILSIWSDDAAHTNAFISRIPLQRGARLEIYFYGGRAKLGGALSGISLTHLSNLQSPTFMEYCPDKKRIELLGPNGRFSFGGNTRQTAPFAEFSLFQLTNIKVFCLTRRVLGPMDVRTRIAFPLLALQALETLAIERVVAIPHLLSTLFADPSASPSLNTLAFLDCCLDEACMEALTKFASDRKTTTSARLHRAIIVSSGQRLPDFASVNALREHVPVVDVRMGKVLRVEDLL